VNKVKSFFGAILLGQVLLSTATPVLADSYSEDYRDYDSSNTRSQVEEDVNWGAVAVFGLGSLFLLDGCFGGSNSEGSYEQQSPEYYYQDNSSAPTYNPSPAPVKPISPFYGDDHTY
jgi:hypothetical protein